MCLLTYSSQHTQSYRILAALATSQPKTLRRTAKVHRERFDSPSGFAVERFCKWNWSDEEYAVPFAFLIHDRYIELLFVYLSHCVYIDQRWAPPSHVAATCKPRSSVKMEPNVRIFTATDTCMCNVFADGGAGCYSECVEPPKPRYKDTTASGKRCSLLHNDSTATVATNSAHAIYIYKYIRQLHNHEYNI